MLDLLNHCASIPNEQIILAVCEENKKLKTYYKVDQLEDVKEDYEMLLKLIERYKTQNPSIVS